jgi:hypothetical protein
MLIDGPFLTPVGGKQLPSRGKKLLHWQTLGMRVREYGLGSKGIGVRDRGKGVEVRFRGKI